MPVAIRVHLLGNKELRQRLKKMNPAVNTRIIREGLLEAAGLIQANAAKIQITGGGRGKGKQLPPLPHKLTSRRGGSGLVGSIKVDRKPLPFAIEVGTDLDYGPVHEFGLGNYPERPFMAPALDAIEPRIDDIIIKHWKREAKL